MFAATLAMAPVYPLRFSCRDETDRAAQAATFKFVGRITHCGVLPDFAAYLVAYVARAEIVITS